MDTASALEDVLRRDRLIVALGLAAITALTWIYTLGGAGLHMAEMPMPATSTMGAAGHAPVWSPAYMALIFAMWWVMMIAMMLPSAAPMVLLFALISRKRRGQGAALLPTWAFLATYIITWGLFSAAAVALQYGLQTAGLVSAAMRAASPLLAAPLLIAAGLYQFSPLKQSCLAHCRGPVVFLTRHWRPGRAGAIMIGLRHAAYCLGCCWALMLLLFVGGVMNIYWIAGLTLFVLAEKLAPQGMRLGRVAGAVLVGAGLWMLAVALMS